MLKAGTKLVLTTGFCRKASSGFEVGDEVTVIDNYVSANPNRVMITKPGSDGGTKKGFINLNEGYRIIEAPPVVEELREVLAQIDALQAKVAKLIAEQAASKPSSTSKFRNVEEAAREDIKTLTKRLTSGDPNLEAYNRHGRMRAPEFVVNERKGTVVALLRYYYVEGIIESRKGKAKLTPGDRFSPEIGKAIALRRSLGLKVPQIYLNAGGL